MKGSVGHLAKPRGSRKREGKEEALFTRDCFVRAMSLLCAYLPGNESTVTLPRFL